ncbi:retinol dehydrogenase 12 [Aspergillus sclerotioniger CBS 115572]|uniref:Retinol dehydrogenase 12 n=1 Tax=Aspergillus sclerotioniger CBS 115572 TaxID=1450535 RepID=A0A317VJ48_9EURO|nr:retinol dehydrogenase 12 [Aspergillus sclerotioniger CBS 115572]PWY73217.1 retinol dehydrogenase 12 [Aspergillus sclerotioniger CBS 115572]
MAFDVATIKSRATQGAFFKRQLFGEPPVVSPTDVDLSGKTAIVTGSNTGLGFECSKQLLDLGLSRLIIAVRSEAKGEEAKKELLAGRRSGKAIIEVWKLDLSRYDSVLAFVERTKSLDRLDIVVNNAGVSKRIFEIIKSTGHEETVQVNHLSNALLTILLIPVLKEKNSPEHPGHLTVVSSDTPAWAKFKEKNFTPLMSAFDKRENFDDQDRYPTSKLLGQLFLRELAKRVPPSVVVINAPNPGLCKSGLVREFRGTLVGYIFSIMELILARKPSVGARALTDAAVKHGAESHGQYIEDGKLAP